VPNGREVLVTMGLVDETSMEPPSLDVKSLLNRILALDVETQNAVFGVFVGEFTKRIRAAERLGLLDEGLSEFWGTAIVRDQALEVGRPSSQDLKVLRARHRWIPLDELLAMERVPYAGDKQRLSLFYAQSWALVHYLMLGRSSVNLELAPPRDFSALSQLEPALAAYVRGGRFRVVRIEGPTDVGSRDRAESIGYPARTLTLAASLAVRAGCLADGERPAAALPLLAKALADNPNEPSVLETAAYVHFQQNDPVEAARWFDRAIASGSASHLAYFYRAILAGPVPDRGSDGQAVRAEDYLRRAIDLDPQFAPAYVRLARLYAQQVGRVTDALPLQQRATELEPENPLYWLELGRLLASLNRTRESREAGERGLATARSASARGLVEAFLRNPPN